MHTTGVSTLDHAPQVVAEWLNELCRDMDWAADKGRAYLLLRSTLHAVRDFLTVEEAVNLSSQLPVLVRGFYFEGWTPARTPVHPRSKQDFLDRVAANFSKVPLDNVEEAVVAVFDLLRRKVSAGEIDQVAHSMRKPLRELWE
ncbi:DUF2267 domain-containing protein [Rhodobacteraceae bacterium 2CG4]|uniref:DUF2267 domain-containing protein n=1 Tax=Halovulum marinum TaxID=2662447 RepID=A0A6L5Z592_9RHOB|nr:DUF2267 domain-containing protein [Halovulum marinum]MSU91479.1 DUF2267 domain-containing protein [Halovulum marinum]